MTGINFFAGEVLAKRLELLRELVPKAVRVAVFVNPANPARAETQVNELQTAARAMGLQIQIFNTSSIREINEAFEGHPRSRILGIRASFQRDNLRRHFGVRNLTCPATQSGLCGLCTVCRIAPNGSPPVRPAWRCYWSKQHAAANLTLCRSCQTSAGFPSGEPGERATRTLLAHPSSTNSNIEPGKSLRSAASTQPKRAHGRMPTL